MRAVNLIPVEQRRGMGGGSGIGSYIVLGVLALVVVVSAAVTVTNRSIADRRHQLADVQARAQASSDEAAALQGYTAFSALRDKRNETVRSLAASRFDWSRTLHEIARTIPSDAWLTSMRGTVSSNNTVEGGASDPLRQALPGPAIELVGCTTTQDNVAAVISSLRRVNGVQRVTLSSSAKNDGGSGGGGATGANSGGGDGDCRHGSAHFPQFSMTLFFATPSAAGTPATGQGTTTTP